MCIRDSSYATRIAWSLFYIAFYLITIIKCDLSYFWLLLLPIHFLMGPIHGAIAVSYTHLRAHETVLDLVCRLLLEKKNK